MTRCFSCGSTVSGVDTRTEVLITSFRDLVGLPRQRILVLVGLSLRQGPRAPQRLGRPDVGADALYLTTPSSHTLQRGDPYPL